MAKIYYNLDNSDYTYVTATLIFYFSSMFYLENFQSKLLKNRESLCYKLSSRYNIEIEAPDYFDIILYSQIEKRGFKIIQRENGVVYKCLKEVKLNGKIVTLQS